MFYLPKMMQFLSHTSLSVFGLNLSGIRDLWELLSGK